MLTVLIPICFRELKAKLLTLTELLRLTIDGYLDIGLIDTIEDMAVCFLGAIIYFVAIAIDWHKKKILFRGLIPQLVNNAVDAPPIISNEISDDVLEVAAEIDGELKLTVCSDLCDVANND